MNTNTDTLNLSNSPEVLAPEPPSVPTRTQEPSLSGTKRSTIALLYAVIFLLLLGGGVLAYENWKLNQQLQSFVSSKQGESESFVADESFSLQGQELQSRLVTTTLEQYLAQECQRSGDENTDRWYLQAEKLPLTLQAVAQGENDSPSGIACVFPEFDSLTNGSLALTSINGSDFSIADQSSIEPGHGGPPLLGEFGELVHEEAETKYFVYLNGTHGFNTVEDYNAEIRAIKEFTTIEGTPFYAVSSRPLAALNEPRFSNTLSEFTTAFEPVTISYQGRSYEAMLGDTNLYLDLPSDQQRNTDSFLSEGFKQDVSGQLGKSVTSVTILSDAENMLRGKHVFRYASSSPESWKKIQAEVVRALVAAYGLENFETFRALTDEFAQIQAK